MQITRTRVSLFDKRNELPECSIEWKVHRDIWKQEGIPAPIVQKRSFCCKWSIYAVKTSEERNAWLLGGLFGELKWELIWLENEIFLRKT